MKKGRQLLGRINMYLDERGAVVLEPVAAEGVVVEEGPRPESGPGQRVDIRLTTNYIVDGQAGRWPLQMLKSISKSELYSRIAERIASNEGTSKSRVRNKATRATERIIRYAKKNGIVIEDHEPALV